MKEPVIVGLEEIAVRVDRHRTGIGVGSRAVRVVVDDRRELRARGQRVVAAEEVGGVRRAVDAVAADVHDVLHEPVGHE